MIILWNNSLDRMLMFFKSIVKMTDVLCGGQKHNILYNRSASSNFITMFWCCPFLDIIFCPDWTHDSTNSICRRMGLCPNTRRGCLWRVSTNIVFATMAASACWYVAPFVHYYLISSHKGEVGCELGHTRGSRCQNY